MVILRFSLKVNRWENRKARPIPLVLTGIKELLLTLGEQRNVKQSWLDETLWASERILPLADPHGNTHYLRRIEDFGDRWLRVVVNPNAEPKRIVTIFFDRRVK